MSVALDAPRVPPGSNFEVGLWADRRWTWLSGERQDWKNALDYAEA
jgi:hypothetical protein